MLRMVSKRKYTVTPRASAEHEISRLALVKVFDNVLAIGGFSNVYRLLKNVSSYNLTTDTWVINLPQLNQARVNSAACFL